MRLLHSEIEEKPNKLTMMSHLLELVLFYLGDYEKSSGCVQGMSEVHYGHAGGMVTIL